MTVEGLRGPSADHWSVPTAVMTRCLKEFLADPNGKKPKDLTPRLIGSFRNLFELAVFYAGDDANPRTRRTPKHVLINDPSWGVGVFRIATKVLSRAGVRVQKIDEYAPLLKKYHKFVKRLPTIHQLKKKDRPMVEELQRFFLALSNEAMNASLEWRHSQ